MNLAAVEKVAKALLYEGYVLYPYRASAVKNRQRFNFGVLYPHAYVEAQGDNELSFFQTECVIVGNTASVVDVKVRFLHLIERAVYEMAGPGSNGKRRAVQRMEVDGQLYQSWEEASEQEVSLPGASVASLLTNPLQWTADVSESQNEECIRNSRGESAGVVVRTQRSLKLLIEVQGQALSDGVFKLSVRLKNLTGVTAPSIDREKALLFSAVSAHTVLGVAGGDFVSLLEPPDDLRPAIEGCKNVGGFPVLLGVQGQHDTMLASPIILYDYPEIAAESAGDLFDSTEIDEILSLRIMTLTDEEKREVRGSDERARRILERTEMLPQEQLSKLHGALRGLRHVQSDEERPQ